MDIEKNKENENKKSRMTILDIKPEIFISSFAIKLKQMPDFAMPEWAKLVKTSFGKERPPQEKEWWYRRAASILRQIYIKGIIGVNKLSTKYGTKKNRGSRPDKIAKGSRKIIRTIIQQAEKAGLISKAEKKGRQLTKQGLALLAEVAQSI